MELKLIHDFIVKPELRSVPGIAEVNASGGYEKQIVVLPSPQKLAALGITFNELAQVIGENVENAGVEASKSEESKLPYAVTAGFVPSRDW